MTNALAPIHFLLLLIVSMPFISPAATEVVNRTIDDTYGDLVTGFKPIYLPGRTTLGVDIWHTQLCGTCAIRPDVTRAFDRTYTAATYHPFLKNMSITLDFKGSAIWVFFINANDAGLSVTTRTLANFTMDSDLPTLYEHVPDEDRKEEDFNVLAYSRTDLVNTQHRLIISTTGDTDAYVNFDYALYSFVDDSATLPSTKFLSSVAAPTTSSIPQTTAMAGDQTTRPSRGIDGVSVAVGLVLGLAAVIICLILLRFRRRQLENRKPSGMAEKSPGFNFQKEINNDWPPTTDMEKKPEFHPGVEEHTAGDTKVSIGYSARISTLA